MIVTRDAMVSNQWRQGGIIVCMFLIVWATGCSRTKPMTDPPAAPPPEKEILEVFARVLIWTASFLIWVRIFFF